MLESRSILLIVRETVFGRETVAEAAAQQPLVPRQTG